MNKGRIIKVISNDYTVLSDKKVICKPRGIFRLNKEIPMVGDIVEFSSENIITKIMPRKNQLARPFVSNVDQVVIIMSLKNPDFSSNLLDKLLVVIEFNRIKPIICFTKIDLLDQKFIEKEYYKKIGYQVFTNEKKDIIKIFKNKVTVFTGQTGVGKSTLLNKLDQDLKLKTGEVSKTLGRGKHTTRHVELHQLGDGLVADTPGFSALSFSDMTKSDIRDNFIEFNEYRQNCQYRDCFHQNEKNCYIKKMVETEVILKRRYQNYLKFLKEVEK